MFGLNVHSATISLNMLVIIQCCLYAVNCKIELVIKVLNSYHNYSVVPRSRFWGNTNLNFKRTFANSGGHTRSSVV